MIAPRVTVLACGNPSRGDDALGPLLMDRLENWRPDGVLLTVVCDYQFQVEHVLELDGSDLVLFVDCAVNAAVPWSLQRVFPTRDHTYTSHALSPAAVMHVHQALQQAPQIPAFVLGVSGVAFELGTGLSRTGAENLELAWRVMRSLLRRPRTELWEKRCCVDAERSWDPRPTAT